MKKERTPQEKKFLSYTKDRRNSYGENDKSSRKAIKFRKAWVNQTFRSAMKHIVKSPIEAEDSAFDHVEDKAKELKRKSWKKSPDQPLGEYIEQKKQRKLNFNNRNLAQ